MRPRVQSDSRYDDGAKVATDTKLWTWGVGQIREAIAMLYDDEADESLSNS